MDITKMLDCIINGLKAKFKRVAVAELNCNNFTAVDVAVEENEDIAEVFRITVIKHKN